MKILKKIVSSILVVLVVSTLVFVAFSVIPGDPAVAKLGTMATPEQLENLRQAMGLTDPLPVRYVHWVLGVLQGDFGTSYSYGIPVTDLIADKLPVTVTMAIISMFIMIVLAVVLAIYSAYHEHSLLGRAIGVINQVIMSIPPFFGGIIITLIFGLTFKLFSPGGYISYDINLGKFIGYMIWPAIAIALPKASMAYSLLLSGLIGEKKKDYVRTAYSRGNSSKAVFYRHILKNACIPVITFLGMAFADMIAGTLVIEQVFGIPGLGMILLTSIQNRDYPVVEAIIVCIAVLVIFSNLLVDILYKVVDPRTR
ncbi:MAG: ABC transporter permease [Lachnospiraceae bacterium]|nr:ABC transporter permease [Candidatus Colinaster equi]